MDVLPIVLAIAGLGILLYGVYLFGLALEPMMNSNIGRKFSALSARPVSGYLFSGGLTFLSQKGTLNCKMLTSLVDMGSLSQRQALPYILGTSLGSGLCLILMMFQGLNVTIYLSLLCLIGAIINMCFKTSFANNLAKGLMGFGMIFLGVHLIGDGAKKILAEPAVYDFVVSIATPLTFIVMGFLLGLITTSSFASVTVLASFMIPSGTISFSAVCLGMLAVGAGTALADLIYSISGHSAESKRVLIFHVFSRWVGALLFSLLYFTSFFDSLYLSFAENAVITLSFVYLVELCLISLIFLPFTKYFSPLLTKLFPFKKLKNNGMREFLIAENAVEVYGVGYPAVLNSTTKLLNMISLAQLKMLDRIENGEINGSLGEIKRIEKALRITENTMMRLSKNVGMNDLSKLNILRNVLSDINYLSQSTLKLYDLGTDLIREHKSLTKEEVSNLKILFEEVNKQFSMCGNMLNEIVAGNKIKNAQLKLMLIENKQVFGMCQKMKTDFFTNYRKNGKYPLGNDANFTCFSIVENINTSLTNIAVKLGILSN